MADPLHGIGSRLHRERMEELALAARVEAVKAASMFAANRVNRSFTVNDVLVDAKMFATFIVEGNTPESPTDENSIV
jgi:hypothetical protein